MHMGNYAASRIQTRVDGSPVADGRVYRYLSGAFLGAGLTFRTRILTPGPGIAVYLRLDTSTTQTPTNFSWDLFEDPTFTTAGTPAAELDMDRSDPAEPPATQFFNQSNASAFGLLLDSVPALLRDQMLPRPFFYWRLAPDTEYLALITNTTAGVVVPLPGFKFIEVDVP